MNTPTKYKLLTGTYEQLGYSFELQKDGRGDWNWEVCQPYVRGECQERATGVAKTRVRAMKVVIALLPILSDP